MNIGDRTRTLTTVDARPPATLMVRWSDGTRAELSLARLLRDKSFKALRDPTKFAAARLGEWGHSVEWSSGCRTWRRNALAGDLVRYRP
ncbi:MAG: DUF2442 domain-containing protein [Rhizomicrobium sp.]